MGAVVVLVVAEGTFFKTVALEVFPLTMPVLAGGVAVTVLKIVVATGTDLFSVTLLVTAGPTLFWVTVVVTVRVVFTVSIVVCVTVVGFWTATVVYNVENFVAGTTLILVFVVLTVCVLKAFRVWTVGIVFVDVAVPQDVSRFVVDLISKTSE